MAPAYRSAMRAWVYDAGFGLLWNVVAADGSEWTWQTVDQLEALIRRENLQPIHVDPDEPRRSAPGPTSADSGLSWLATP